jgi:hypothetical protein
VNSKKKNNKKKQPRDDLMFLSTPALPMNFIFIFWNECSFLFLHFIFSPKRTQKKGKKKKKKGRHVHEGLNIKKHFM